MNNQNNNKRRQDNRARKQARDDLWDMLKAFSILPEVNQIHFANSEGELDIVRTEREKPTKRIGFGTDAIGTDCDSYDDEIRPAEEFDDYIRKILKR